MLFPLGQPGQERWKGRTKLQVDAGTGVFTVRFEDLLGPRPCYDDNNRRSPGQTRVVWKMVGQNKYP
jgi:hypothetical protein